MNDRKYVYGCPNVDCMYRQKNDGSCEYFMMEGVTRTGLHRDEPGVDINNPCREYTPGEILRKHTIRITY